MATQHHCRNGQWPSRPTAGGKSRGSLPNKTGDDSPCNILSSGEQYRGRFKSRLKGIEGVCLTKWEEIISQEKPTVVESSASHDTFDYSWYYKQTSILGCQMSSGVVRDK